MRQEEKRIKNTILDAIHVFEPGWIEEGERGSSSKLDRLLYVNPNKPEYSKYKNGLTRGKSSKIGSWRSHVTKGRETAFSCFPEFMSPATIKQLNGERNHL